MVGLVECRAMYFDEMSADHGTSPQNLEANQDEIWRGRLAPFWSRLMDKGSVDLHHRGC